MSILQSVISITNILLQHPENHRQKHHIDQLVKFVNEGMKSFGFPELTRNQVITVLVVHSIYASNQVIDWIEIIVDDIAQECEATATSTLEAIVGKDKKNAESNS